jgi:hypothetical protein
MAPEKGDDKYTDYVIELAKPLQIRSGVINVPRVYFDEIPLSAVADGITVGTPGTLVNGEQFPVRLTRMVASIRYLTQAGLLANDIFLQRVGLRMRFHDQYYMNPNFLPVPLWGNQCVAPPVPVGSNLAHWDFVKNGQPFVLSARDTLIVSVQLQDAANPSSAVPVSVMFTGIGELSRRPYMFSGSVDLDTVARTDLSTVDFRNDGIEPVVITDMTVSVSAQEDATTEGNINRLRINVRQVGNGTNADWFVGPQTPPPPIPLMQATLCGVTTGRALVHEFPGDGLIWLPGVGITVENQARIAGMTAVLVIGFSGYIMVQ